MILVPFSGWSDATAGNAGCQDGRNVGGAQLIDFKNDMLMSRAATSETADIRRALLQGDQLLTVSDERVQSFDITDRDSPKQVSQVVLGRNTFRALQLADGAVARISQDIYTAQPSIDFAASADAGEINQSYGELDLSNVAGGGACGSLSLDDSFVKGSELDVLYTKHNVDSAGNDQEARGLLVIDASDPTHARLVSDTRWDNADSWQPYDNFYTDGAYASSRSIVRTEHTLSILESTFVSERGISVQRAQLRVLDLRTPNAVLTTLLPLAKANYLGLLADADTLLTNHFTDTGSRARFYVDRIDVSDPSAPRTLATINVPGPVLHYDSSSARAFTVEQLRVVVPNLTVSECYDRFAYADYEIDPGNSSASNGGAASSDDPVSVTTEAKGLCTGYRQRLNLVSLGASAAQLDDTLQLDEDQQLTTSSMGDSVVFATLGHTANIDAGDRAIDCFGACGAPLPSPPAELLVLGGFSAGKFEIGHLHVEHSNDPGRGFWGAAVVYAVGKQALLVGQTEIAVIDASTASTPTMTRTLPLPAPALYVDIRAESALLTLGEQGVQWVPLD
jgi:hypothetical protein